MPVKCKYCGKSINKTTAFKSCYCSEEEYHMAINLNLIKDSIYESCCEVVGYKIINTSYFSNLKTLSIDIPFEEIDKYLTDNKTKLKALMSSKSFTSEFAKFKYLFTCIKNNYRDWTETINTTQEVQTSNFEFYGQKYTPKQRKKALEFYEGD